MKTSPVSETAFEGVGIGGPLVRTPISGLHDIRVTLGRNHFKGKSLSSFACNLFVGCGHGCRFCYVADTTMGRSKQKDVIEAYGVVDPFQQWGDYVFVRPLSERHLVSDIEKAQSIPLGDLNADGNRAVMFCSTTDPYMIIRNENSDSQRRLNYLARHNMRRALELILENSDLNVRILTRSPLAIADFDIMKRFGNRLLFGVSIPTLDAKLSKVYEGRSPAPQQRLKLLESARDAGIPVYVAVAPVFPEQGKEGMLEVFSAVRKLDPVTVFMEPINRRRGIVERIRQAGAEHGVSVKPEIFEDAALWAPYAIQSLKDAEEVAWTTGLHDKLHLWPDSSLETQTVLRTLDDPVAHLRWLHKWWGRISEWPGKASNPWPEEMK
jgi:DNA repair photolyase